MKVVDIHIHGGFGICFDNARQNDIRDFAKRAFEKEIAAFCPTLTGDNVEKLREKIQIINDVMQNQKADEARILGVNLEGTFLNKNRSGIQNPENFLNASIENFKKIANGLENAVKIVVIAPENQPDADDLIKYLKQNRIKVHFGHTTTRDIQGADGICHLYNAMEPITHKHETAAIKALLSNKIYTEIIADTIHVHPDILKLTFKTRPIDKIILISDALPIAGSNLEFIEFCGKKIFKNGRDENGTLGGSITLLPDIANNLVKLGILPLEYARQMAYNNPLRYLEGAL